MVFRSDQQSIISEVFTQDDEMCQVTDLFYWGRAHCGPIFRNPEGTTENRDQYSFINPGVIMHFSLTE